MWRYVLRPLLLLLVIVAASGLLWLRSSLPRIGGELALPGLSAAVRIDRDAVGVPTIVAANDRDAAFALGFVHAQDRLFQMDLERHYGAGRLSEWFGPRAVEPDRLMRTLGLYRAAERQLAAQSPEVRDAIQAYADGLNAFLATRRTALPPEYYLLDIRPEPWRPADTLVWGKLMAIQLAGNYRGELLRMRLLQRLTPDEIALLYPPYPKEAPVTLGELGAALRDLPIERLYAALPPAVGPIYASNNWVLSGAHTVSGKPLLADDPHLRFAAPGVWYLAHIETPTTDLAGATAPGTPLVLIGHNAHIAWGFTTTTADIEDLFIERLDPADPTRYLTPEGSRPFEVRHETIGVRGEAPVELTVRATRHGPVVSDVVEEARSAVAGGHVLALQATFLADGDRSPEAIWSLDRARDWNEFRAALTHFDGPPQNMVYGDTEGNIGFIAPGKIPIRGKGEGWFPAPGWTGEYDWTGFIPFDALPMSYNPPSGRIVSANNKIVPDDYPYFISRDWDLPNRARRINALLDQTPRQSPETSAEIQADTLSLMALDLLPLMLRAPPASKRAEEAMELLRAWDGRMAADRVEPLLFTAWLREFNRTVLADKLGQAFEDYWGLHPNVIHTILTERPDWCNDRTTPIVEVCDEQLAAALDRALAQLTQAYGDDMHEWLWGRAHPAVFANPVWANVPVLGRLFDLRITTPGGYDTLNRGVSAIGSATAPYASVHGAGLRMIADLSDLSQTRFMVTPGQSGNPLSPQWRDLMRRWRDFDWLKLDGAAPVASLRLVPP